jgi:hypothetical protein
VRMMVWLFILLFTVGVAAIGLAGSFAPAV